MAWFTFAHTSFAPHTQHPPLLLLCTMALTATGKVPLALSPPLGDSIDALPEGASVKINAGNPDEKPRIALIFSTAYAFGQAGQKDILNDTRQRVVVYKTDQSVGSARRTIQNYCDSGVSLHPVRAVGQDLAAVNPISGSSLGLCVGDPSTMPFATKATDGSTLIVSLCLAVFTWIDKPTTATKPLSAGPSDLDYSAEADAARVLLPDSVLQRLQRARPASDSPGDAFARVAEEVNAENKANEFQTRQARKRARHG